MTEPIAVILLTYDSNGSRTDYALAAAKAMIENLVYPELAYYVADDGSRQEHIDAVLKCFGGYPLLGWHTLPGGTYGRNCNEAWTNVKDKCRLTLWVEDDWVLKEKLDLYPYAAMLMEREDIGMVRLGYLNLNMRGTVFGHGGRLYWRLDREANPYVFTGHPSLRHDRFRASYGRYPEGLNPGETELAYALQFRNGNGPDIVYPAALAEYGPFAHIGERQSYQ